MTLRVTGTPLAAAALVLLLPAVAYAHTGAGPTHSLVHGFTHPLAGADHLLAMFAVGLWGAQRGGRAVWLLPLVFVVTMLVAGAAGMLGAALPAVEAGIAASVIVLGVTVALAAQVPLAASIALVAVFAVFHGHAHGAEMPAANTAAAYGAGFALATSLLHGAGIAFARVALPVVATRRAALVRTAGAVIGVAGAALWLL